MFVPPVGITAAVDGRIRRPAIYEVRQGTKVSDLLDLAGGLAPDAAAGISKLDRIDSSGERVVLDLDLTTAEARSIELQAGDVITVPRVLDDVSRAVSLEGHVLRPGRYAWREGMRLTDVLGSLQALKVNADQRYLLIRRERMPDRRIETLSADAVRAFAERGSDADPPLASRDRILVFQMQKDRGAMLSDLLSDLRVQASDNDPVALVTVHGRVKAPGQYPLEQGMTVSDLVRAGGGLDEAAYSLVAELTRLNVVNGESRHTEVTELKLSEILAGGAADLPLRAYDQLVIKETPDWSEQGTVRLQGEVRFPGDYPIRKGETLSSVVMRAGGLTEHAFPEGSVFTRQEIKEQERRQLDSLANRLQSDLALVALQGVQTNTPGQNPSEALAVGAITARPIAIGPAHGPSGHRPAQGIEPGRFRRRRAAPELRHVRDPALRQYVAVIGEVQNPTSHVWRNELSRDDYLSLSGGPNEKANADRIYVVRADGSVVTQSSSRWFSRSGDVEMRPGDTIVVPLDTQKMRPLPLWTAVTTIIYNLAVTVAAIGSF